MSNTNHPLRFRLNGALTTFEFYYRLRLSLRMTPDVRFCAILPHNVYYVVFLFFSAQKQVKALELTAMDGAGFHRIDARSIDACVP